MAEQLPDWERLLEAAARLQSILPEATLVGWTAAAITAGHRQSMDADHVIAGLIAHFDEVLADRFLILLHIFRKDTDQVPEAEKKLALERWIDFTRRMDAPVRNPPRAMGRDAP